MNNAINVNNATSEFLFFGEQNLLQQPKTVFFTPFKGEENIFKAVQGWMRTLDPMAGCIVCGNSTGLERFALRKLLQRGFAVIVPLATTIPTVLEEMNIGWKLKDEESVAILSQALEEHRLLLVASTENVSVSTPTSKTIAIRNEWMRTYGDRFVITQLEPFSYYDRLLVGAEVQELMHTAEKSATTEEATKMGWDIYRRLKSAQQDATVEIHRLLSRFIKLHIEQPSMLYTLVQNMLYKKWKNDPDLDFYRQQMAS